MAYPFEVDRQSLGERLDEFVDKVFADLQSQFLVLPRGDSFVEYSDFQSAYEVLKRRTSAFRRFTYETVWAAMQENALCFGVIRTILGVSPPEWADLAKAEDESGVSPDVRAEPREYLSTRPGVFRQNRDFGFQNSWPATSSGSPCRCSKRYLNGRSSSTARNGTPPRQGGYGQWPTVPATHRLPACSLRNAPL